MILIISTYEHEESTIDVCNWLIYKKANFQRLNGMDLKQPNYLEIIISNDETELYLKKSDISINLTENYVVWYRRWFNTNVSLPDFNIVKDTSLNKKIKRKRFCRI